MSKLESQIPIEIVKRYSIMNNIFSPLLIVGIYMAVGALIYLDKNTNNEIIFLAVLFLIAGLQAHLSILMHEGAHFRLHKNDQVNDFWGNFFCALPLTTLLKDYRHFHLNHHKHLGDNEKDPERHLYKKLDHKYQFTSKKEYKFQFLRDILGISILRSLMFFNHFSKTEHEKKKLRALNTSEMIQITFFLLLIGFSIYLNFWQEIIIYWFLPLFFIFPIFLLWHGQGEHLKIDTDCYEENTFTHEYPFWVNFFVYPINSGYHLVHHLFPTVPWYNLKAFHKELLNNEEYRKRSEKLTVDGQFFGKKTIYKNLVRGE